MIAPYRYDIDGLRALAVWLVVIFHAFPALLPAGFIGVDIFFVISGFIISRSIMCDLQAGTFNIFAFYGRRIRRIFPTLILVMATVLAVGHWQLFPDDYQLVANHTRIGAICFSNYTLWQEAGYFDVASDTKPLMHLWSLAVEEHFYILWPLLLWYIQWLFKQKNRVPLVVTACMIWGTSFVYHCYIMPSDASLAFYSPIARFWELTTGGIIAFTLPFWQKYLTPRYSTLLSLCFIGLLSIGLYHLNGGATATAAWPLWSVCAAACFIIAGVSSSWLNHKVFAHRVMGWQGKISYALYLWHWPVLSLYSLLRVEEASSSIKILLILLAVALATVSERFVERPLRFGKLQLGKTLLLCASMLSLIKASTNIVKHQGFSKRYPQPQVQKLLQPVDFAWQQYIQFNTCHIQDIAVTTHPATCIQNRDLVLWGDSHASSLYAGLSQLPLQGTQLTQAGCPPLWKLPDLRYARLCESINDNVLNTVTELQPKTLILHAAWWHHDYPVSKRVFKKRLKHALDKIHMALPHTRLVVVGPVPRWRFNPAKHTLMLWRQTHDEHLWTQKRVPALMLTDIDMMMQHLVEQRGHTYVSPLKILCTPEGCLTRLSDNPADGTAVDYGHLSRAGALFVVRYLQPIL